MFDFLSLIAVEVVEIITSQRIIDVIQSNPIQSNPIIENQIFAAMLRQSIIHTKLLIIDLGFY
jgi:hypothetical protein